MLSIGSIVFLKDGTKKLMILNRGPIIKNEGKEQLFDYSACEYPVGLVAEKVYYFNAENIDEVVFEGYSDNEEERFAILYDKWLAENGSTYQKGIVTKPI